MKAFMVHNHLKKEVLNKYPFWQGYMDGLIDFKEYSQTVNMYRLNLKKNGFSDEQIAAISRIKNPELNARLIDQKVIRRFFEQLDQVLITKGKKLNIVLIGGTNISFIQGERTSKDLDFIIITPLIDKVRSFRILRPAYKFFSHTRKRNLLHIFSLVPLAYVLKIDLFLDCDLPSINITDFEAHVLTADELLRKNKNLDINIGKYNNLQIFFLHPLDLICSKVLVGRRQDLEDCRALIKLFPGISKKKIKSRLISINPKFEGKSWVDKKINRI